MELVQEKHIIHRQREKEEEFLKEFHSKDYTMEKPLVVINPYHIAPLTALVLFKTETPTEMKVVVKGKDEANDLVHQFGRTKEHILPIYGLYVDEATEVQFISSMGHKHTLEIESEKVEKPEQLPEVLDLKNNDNYLEDNWIFVTPTSKHYPVAFDNAGDIRWYAKTNLSFDLKRLDNGHLLVGTDRLIQSPYFISGLFEMALSGKIYKEYRMPGGYHHDIQELSNGNIIALSQEANSQTVEDTMVLLDRETGEVLREWDFKDMFPHKVSGSGSYSDEDWAHGNGVAYSEDRDEVFISARHMDLMFCFSYETGDLKFVIGDPEGWDPDFVDKYFFTTNDEDLEWNYEQHSVQLTPEGNLFFFDNGHYRSKDPKKYWKNVDNYSRGVLYELDRENRKVRQLYQYGKERGANFFSPYICNVEYYEKDRYMVHSGGIGFKDGEPLEGLSTRYMYDDSVTPESITVELYKDEVQFELRIAANMYRAKKLTPYFAGEEFEEEQGEILGSLAETELMDVEVPYEESNKEIPENYDAEAEEEIDRYRFTATYSGGELAMLFLVNNEETRRYFISTSASERGAMCIGTFLKEDSRTRDLFINKRGLSGKYDVYFYLDGTLYQTGLEFEGFK